MDITLIEGSDVFAPQRLGTRSVLLVGDTITKVGSVPAVAVHSLANGPGGSTDGSTDEVNVTTIDARGCYVVPGLIDLHAHIIGAGGEQGFATRMPEILMSQLVMAGTTTVIGLLGTDTSTRNMSCLHAKACQLWDEGLTCFIYTGGFELPPTTLTGSVINNLVMIDKVIGTGELAISDPRWLDPELSALAHVVYQTALGGKTAGKAGVTHFHTGPSKKKLGILHSLLDSFEIAPESLYVTHINRSRDLIDDAITLARRGVHVDMDTVEEDTVETMCYYLQQSGPQDKITVSSDAHTPAGSSRKFYKQFVALVQEGNLALETVLPFFTSNTAAVLKLPHKGRLAAGCDADVLVLRKDTLELVHLFARGRQIVRGGAIVQPSKQEQQVRSGDE